jgi:Asp-tRNA(Asn)/Glu-tRNA(Gln) amidotransferase A subunit family amidase
LSDELTKKSARELVALIRSRVASPVEIMEAHLRRIEQVNPSINAIVTTADDAINRAREAEDAVIHGHGLGPLHGLPITVKDTIDTAGLRTTSGSRLRMNYLPNKDAAVVARLKRAGAIILGKTNTPEMAIPYETDNPIFGRTNNPQDLARTAGGSSGGEAAAIAAHLSPAGVGSDLSGSIRVPAHFCGIAGLKPTTGTVSMEGHVPEAGGTISLGACIGPMARTVDDLSLLFDVMKTSPESTKASQRQAGALYIDDTVTPVTSETEAAVRKAAQALQEAGFEVREERPPGIAVASRLWIELFANTAAEQLREFYRGREDQAGPLVAEILHNSRERSSFEDKIETAERLAKAVVERERLREELLRWMKRTPLILAPVGATPAFEHGAGRVDVKGESISVFRAFSYSQTFNVFGLPAVAVPVCRSADNLPIGVQIIGRPFAEVEVLRAAKIVERLA